MQSLLSNCPMLREISPPLVFSFQHDESLAAAFAAHINVNDWTIHIKVRSDFESMYNRESLCLIVYTLLKHEEGHWTICPFDGIYHLKICAAVKRAYNKVFRGKEISAQMFRLGFNLFEDLIVDKQNISLDERYRSGTDLIHKICKKENSKEKDKLFQILFKIRECFLLDKTTKDKGILKVLKTISGGHPDEHRWEDMAYDFAEAIFSLIKRRVVKSELLKPPQEQFLVPILTSESIFEKKMQEDSEYRDRTTKEYFRIVSSGAIEAAADIKTIFPLVVDKESLDLYFSSITENIKLEHFKKDSGSYTYAHLGKRRLAEDHVISPGRIKWPSTKIISGINDESFVLYEKEIPLRISTEGVEPGIIYDLAFILDGSGSMGWLFDTRASYHTLVVAVYSLLDYLKSTDKGYHVNCCAIKFASSTFYSRWLDYSSLRDLKLNYILRDTGGATNLSPTVLRQMTDEAKGAFLGIMVSDGEIHNLKETVEAIGELIQSGNHFCLIQIGESTSFMSEIRTLGGDVYNIRDTADLKGLILKKGKEHW